MEIKRFEQLPEKAKAIIEATGEEIVVGALYIDKRDPKRIVKITKLE
jgi:hypothetical protein